MIRVSYKNENFFWSFVGAAIVLRFTSRTGRGHMHIMRKTISPETSCLKRLHDSSCCNAPAGNESAIRRVVSKFKYKVTNRARRDWYLSQAVNFIM